MEATEKVNQTKKQSPNLLSKEFLERNPLIEKYHVDISIVAKVLIIITQIVYILLLGYDSKLMQDVKKLENQVQANETEIRSNKDTVDQIEQIIAKTNKLKTLEKERNQKAPKIEDILRLMPTGTNMLNSLIEKNSMDTTIETKGVLGVSILMNNYFEEGLADSVVIKSANLNPNDGTFTTHMEVIFR